MDDAARVRGLDAGEHPLQDRDGVAERDAAAVLRVRRQRDPFEEIHHQVRAAVLRREAVVHTPDVRVDEARAGAPLIHEACHDVLVRHEVGVEESDRYPLAPSDGLRRVHGPHAASTDLARELVLARQDRADEARFHRGVRQGHDAVELPANGARAHPATRGGRETGAAPATSRAPTRACAGRSRRA